MTLSDFDKFNRKMSPSLCSFASMKLYDENMPLPAAFHSVKLENIFGEVISKKGVRQFRIAEIEKYAHVTYFFNGGDEKPFTGEDRFLIPSPKDVATYDQKPEMSAYYLKVARKIQLTPEMLDTQGFPKNKAINSLKILRMRRNDLPAAYPRNDLISLIPKYQQLFWITGRPTHLYHKKN